MITIDPKVEKTHAVESDNQVTGKDGKKIENEKDVHDIDSGNAGEANAKKDMLNGPANDLVGMPDDDKN